MNSDPNPSPNSAAVKSLLAQVAAVDQAIAASPGYVLRARRSEILDELQDAVGLNGKMVTERDILDRAAKLIV